VQTDASGTAKTYNLRVKVHRTEFSSVSAQKDFTVVLVDICNSATLLSVTPPTTPERQVYTIGSNLKEVPFGAFTLSPAYCPSSLGWSVSPPPADANAIEVSTSKQIIKIESSNLASGMETVPTTSVPKSYSVTVYLVTENGTMLDSGGKEIRVQVDLSNPCVLATISLAAAVPTAIPDYLIGSAQQNIRFVFSRASDGLGSLCPSKTFEVAMADGSAVDATLWTFNSANERLELHTSDYMKAGTYTLQLRVKYNAAAYTAWQGT